MTKTILVGRIAATPELRTTVNGNQNVTFNIAVSKEHKNEDGTRDADFIGCTAWGSTAEAIAKYCTKGALIGIVGRIQTKSYEAQDGTKRYVTEVYVEKCSFLSTKPQEVKVEETKEEDPFKEFGEELTLTDEDLPF